MDETALAFFLRSLVCLSQTCCWYDLQTIGIKPAIHYSARADPYGCNSNVHRFPVPDDKVPWSVDFPEYQPTDYTSDRVLEGPAYADKEIADLINPKWNCLDGLVDRRSHAGPYDVVNGVPMNPVGRTGVSGRGCLGRWGPNHAADPVVTRWKRDEEGHIFQDKATSTPVLQVVAIRRRDDGVWAFPGGMVDAGEKFAATAIREFSEEALDSLEADDSQNQEFSLILLDFFSHGQEIHRGYSDDPRNTDNSWVETIAFNFHDETGSVVDNFDLHPGDDATDVMWMDVDRDMILVWSHRQVMKKVARKHSALW